MGSHPLGKGEADSSILSGSTSKPPAILGFFTDSVKGIRQHPAERHANRRVEKLENPWSDVRGMFDKGSRQPPSLPSRLAALPHVSRRQLAPAFQGHEPRDVFDGRIAAERGAQGLGVIPAAPVATRAGNRHFGPEVREVSNGAFPRVHALW